jgi:lipopolysaccharide heptosyltransferase I
MRLGASAVTEPPVKNSLDTNEWGLYNPKQSHSMRILVVRLSAMGDLVQTLPALTDAAKAIPGIKFDWVVDESFAQVPSWHSHVESVFPAALRRWGKNWVDAFQSGEPQALVKRLRARNYDLIIDVQGGFKSAIASWLAKGLRAGHDRRGVHDWGAQFFYQKQIAVPKGMHSILRMRRLLAASLGYPFPHTDADYGIVRDRLGRRRFGRSGIGRNY